MRLAQRAHPRREWDRFDGPAVTDRGWDRGMKRDRPSIWPLKQNGVSLSVGLTTELGVLCSFGAPKNRKTLQFFKELHITSHSGVRWRNDGTEMRRRQPFDIRNSAAI